jgi:hypothetical protein
VVSVTAVAGMPTAVPVAVAMVRDLGPLVDRGVVVVGEHLGIS